MYFLEINFIPFSVINSENRSSKNIAKFHLPYSASIFVWIASDLQALYCGAIVDELNLEENVGILEQSLLQTDDQELGGLEVLADHEADILRVRKVKG